MSSLAYTYVYAILMISEVFRKKGLALISSQLQLPLRRSKVEDKMSRPVTIETPFPSLAETAHTLGVSPAEAERVQKILAEHKPRARANGGPRRGLRYARKRASKKA